jgi:hypothetical protein
MGDIEDLQHVAVEKLRDALFVIAARDRQTEILLDALDAIADYIEVRSKDG